MNCRARLETRRLAVLAIASIIWFGQAGCHRDDIAQRDHRAAERLLEQLSDSTLHGAVHAGGNTEQDPDFSEELAAFCGDCHALPNPDSFERDAWYEKIRAGYEFYAQSRRSDLAVPAFHKVLTYYRARAPQRIEFRLAEEMDDAWSQRFQKTKLDWQDGEVYSLPGISSIVWTKALDPDGLLIVSDMRDGSVSAVRPKVDAAHSSRDVLTRVASPGRTLVHDLNDDGLQDILICDLGSFNPYDHGFGKLVWLRREEGSEEYQSVTLLDTVGRVSDLSVADFDGDGVEDLALAEFGHRRAGGIRLLSNPAVEGETSPKFARPYSYLLDMRPGTVRLAAHDWNQDGRLDLAALVSQEYETLDLFFNGGGVAFPPRFSQETIYLGRDLTSGSVSMQPVDLDLDGDQDFLVVNGDCFDDNYAHPNHGVHWLENKGNLNFIEHTLVRLPGAYQAAAADFDRDADMDVIVVANLPTKVLPESLQSSIHSSVLLLEQTNSGEFQTRVLEQHTARYAALECGDFNGDGNIDFVIGTQLFGTDPPDSPEAQLPRLTVWWNRG